MYLRMVEYIKHAPHTVGKDPIWIHFKPHLWWSYHYFVLGKILFASWLNSLFAGFLQNYIPSWWFNHPTIFSSKKRIPNYPKFIFHTLAQQNSIPKHPIFSLRGNPVKNPPNTIFPDGAGKLSQEPAAWRCVVSAGGLWFSRGSLLCLLRAAEL